MTLAGPAGSVGHSLVARRITASGSLDAGVVGFAEMRLGADRHFRGRGTGGRICAIADITIGWEAHKSLGRDTFKEPSVVVHRPAGSVSE
jgi:hypothetical protein